MFRRSCYVCVLSICSVTQQLSVCMAWPPKAQALSCTKRSLNTMSKRWQSLYGRLISRLRTNMVSALFDVGNITYKMPSYLLMNKHCNINGWVRWKRKSVVKLLVIKRHQSLQSPHEDLSQKAYSENEYKSNLLYTGMLVWILWVCYDKCQCLLSYSSETQCVHVYRPTLSRYR